MQTTKYLIKHILFLAFLETKFDVPKVEIGMKLLSVLMRFDVLIKFNGRQFLSLFTGFCVFFSSTIIVTQDVFRIRFVFRKKDTN